jgi:hypothetical protein
VAAVGEAVAEVEGVPDDVVAGVAVVVAGSVVVLLGVVVVVPVVDAVVLLVVVLVVVVEVDDDEVVCSVMTGTVVVTSGSRLCPVETTTPCHCTVRTALPVGGAVVTQLNDVVVCPVVNGPGKLSSPHPVPVGDTIDQLMSPSVLSPR